MTVSERNDAVSRSQLCRNCLKPGHYARTCESVLCRHCFQKHHSMLHPDQIRSSVPYQQQQSPRPTATTSVQQQPRPRQQNSNQTTHTPVISTPANTTNPQTTDSQATPPQYTSQTTSQNYVALPVAHTHNIILSTALIRIKDRFGNAHMARALLDSCSQHCLMTQEFSKRLKLRRESSYLPIQGIGTSRCVSTHLVNAEVCPRSDQISNFASEMQFQILPKLNIALPTSYVDPSTIQLPDWMLMADPEFYRTGPVDVIIGAEYYMDLLTNEKVKPAADGPTLYNTVFGWIISGRIFGSAPQSTSFVSVAAIARYKTDRWNLDRRRPVAACRSIGTRKHKVILDNHHPFSKTKSSNHYLSDLHNRTKWTKKKDNVAVGTMVLLKDENLPPLKWQLGRVSNVHPGADGNIRVVTVRTKDGSYQRAISKICILSIRDNNLTVAQGKN